ncbi:MAG: DUF4912 domain-containing protein [Treponema sp.]|nr:DUF4912 domain-containing protein [Treponema sp.]
MEETLITRAYLDSLSTGELIRLADTFGVYMPLDLDRILIIEELLELSSLDDSLDDEEQEPDLEDSVLTETAALPKQYNITFIELMIRDPLWAFAFWEIKTQDKEQFEKSPSFQGYYLKLTAGQKTEELFTVQISPEDHARYINLDLFSAPAPGTDKKDRQYRVELCVALGETETILASSNVIEIPPLPEALPGPAKTGSRRTAAANPLVKLSGFEDFQIIRRNERTPRSKGRPG